MNGPGAASVDSRKANAKANTAKAKDKDSKSESTSGKTNSVRSQAGSANTQSSRSPHRARKYRQYSTESLPRTVVTFRLESSLDKELRRVVRGERFTGIGDALETAVKEFLSRRSSVSASAPVLDASAPAASDAYAESKG